MQRPKFKKDKIIEEMLRVDHAGEYGAKRIYTGQLDYIKTPESYELIKHMYEQELVHLNFFEAKLKEQQIRPTLLMPFWHVAGYFMGAVTAKMGTKSAMVCTESVEEVIDKHYHFQKSYLKNHLEHKELYDKIEQFQQEEIEHKDIASEYLLNTSLKDKILSKIIKSICKAAIMVSKKI